MDPTSLTTAQEFLAPRQLLSGRESRASVGGALRSWGVEPLDVAVVADSAVAQAGLLEDALVGLRDEGFRPSVFAEIYGEPDLDTVLAAAKFGRLLNPVAVVGIGGGSALDTAKLVALLASNEVEPAELGGRLVPATPVLPLALVPTTTGTGSEATRIAMLSIDGQKRIVGCNQFVPLVAALDGSLVAALPSVVVAATAMDALAHAVESILSLNRSALTVAFAERAIEIVLAEIDAGVTTDGGAARERLLFAAYQAGLALNAGVVVGHSIGYVIAQRAGLSHGASCSLALPYCIAYSTYADGALEDRTLETMARLLTAGESSDPQDAALAVDQLAQRLGLPTSLEGVGVDEADLDDIATEIVTRYPRPHSPRPLDRARLRRLLACMHSGDIGAACSLMQEHARI